MRESAQTRRLRAGLEQLSNTSLRNLVWILLVAFGLTLAVTSYHVWKTQEGIRQLHQLQHNFATNSSELFESLSQFQFSLLSASLWRGESYENIMAMEKDYQRFLTAMNTFVHMLETYLPGKLPESTDEIRTLSENIIVIARDMPEEFKESYFDGIDSLRVIESMSTQIRKHLNTCQESLNALLIEREKQLLGEVSTWRLYTLASLLGLALVILYMMKRAFRNDAIIKTFDQMMSEELEQLRKNDHMLIQQSKLAAMGEMIGNIAHQWRQPLNAIGLVFSRIDIAHQFNDLTDEVVTSSVKQGEELVQGMSRTIDDFRNFFNPEKEKSEFVIQKNFERLKPLIKDALGALNIEISFDVPDEDIFFTGYPNELLQVLMNLISNAKDIISERKIKEGKIAVTLMQEETIITIAVADNGGGIPEEVMPKIFEPYYTTKFQSHGTGIGLYMSKQIIENNMGGKLKAENTDTGACFTITLHK